MLLAAEDAVLEGVRSPQMVSEGGLKRRVVFYILIRLGLATGLLALTAVLVVGEESRLLDPGRHFALVAATYLIMGLSAAGLPAVGNLHRFAWLQLAADTSIITALVSLTGGTGSIFTPLYMLSIVASSTLVYQRGALILAGINSTVFLTLGLLAGMRIGPLAQGPGGGGPSAPVYAEVLLTIFGFFLVALLAGQLAEQLRATGRQLEAEEAYSRSLQAELAQVAQTIRSGLAIIGRDGTLRSANQRALELFPNLESEVAPEAIPGWQGEEEGLWEVVIPHGESVRHVIVTRSVMDDGRNVLTLEDVTSLRQIERQLRREERYNAVGHLAAAIAHEVRNPLASLSGAVQLLHKKKADGPLHEIIHREVGRINDLVTQFLETTRPASLKPEMVDLGLLVSEVVETFAKDGRYREMIQVVEETDDLPLLKLDAERMRQVLWNLLLNAAQAMPSGGIVHVSATQVGERVRLLVSDEGVGIAEEDLSRVFDPFYTTRQGGTGLGLATVERVAREHGGSVWARSEPGGGTAFAIWLPLSGEFAPDAAAPEGSNG